MRHGLVRVGHLLDRWLGRITSACLVIAGALITLMAIIMTYSVVRRYIFHNPDSAAVTFVSIMMLGCVIFAFADISRRKKNITVDFVSQFIPRKVREPLLSIGGPVLGLIFCTVLTMRTWDNAIFSLEIGHKTQTIPVMPVFPLQIVIPLCTGLVGLVLISELVRYFASLAVKKTEKAAD